MDDCEKWFARTQLQLALSTKRGMEFQHFFEKIMKYTDSDFRSVKPWGSRGDEKNDGFIDSKGQYFQVYSPENSEYKIAEAVKKMQEDLTELISFWKVQLKRNLSECIFVFNCEDTNVLFEEAIDSLKKEHPEIKFSVMFRNNLETIFISLSKDKIQMLIGGIPSPEDLMTQLDYSILPEVIGHILSMKFTISAPVEKLIAPKYDAKIKFNNLTLAKNYLDTAYFYINQINAFFADEPQKKEVLREKFSKLYAESLVNFPISEDAQFMYILNKASPNDTLQIKSAVMYLMAVYFESCDIFKEPLP